MNKDDIVDFNKPFHGDEFDREQQIRKLYSLIVNNNKGFVSCLNSEFGRGKSTFFKMFDGFIKQQYNIHENDILSVYYDAWENDYIDEPLLSLISAIENSYAFYSKEVSKASLGDVYSIISDLANGVSKFLSLGTIDFKTMKENMRETPERNAYSNYKKKKNVKKYIQDLLQNLPSKKKVFFIDELDRCKPTFALEILEIIKHFFNMEDYFFIIAVDKKQLYSTIKLKYGSEIDCPGYLRRFFDFDITMNPFDPLKYLDLQLRNMNTNYNDMSMFQDVLNTLIVKNEANLRDIDRMIYYLNLLEVNVGEFRLKDRRISNSMQQDYYNLNLSVLGVLLYLKVMREDLYIGITRSQLNRERLTDLAELMPENQEFLWKVHHTNIGNDGYGLAFKNTMIDLFLRIGKKLEQAQPIKVWNYIESSLGYHDLLVNERVSIPSFNLVQLIDDIEIIEIIKD